MKQAWNDTEDQTEDGPQYVNNVVSASRKPNRFSTISKDDSLQSRGIAFTLYNANGGTVVELRDYDPVQDRHTNVMYVISKDQDLGEQLSHIVTMEALKR